MKDPRGRKPGLPLSAARFEDLLIALGVNAVTLAGILGVSPSLISKWKYENAIDHRHIRRLLDLLRARKNIKTQDEKEAHKRIVTYLESYAAVLDASGSALPTELSQLLLKETPTLFDGGKLLPALSLSGIPERVLVQELENRGWEVVLKPKK
jgi:hypothetical protein